jgi:hypothetical protein
METAQIIVKEVKNGIVFLSKEDGKSKTSHQRKVISQDDNLGFKFEGCSYSYNEETNILESSSGAIVNTVSANEPAQSEFDINERFEFLGNFANMVIKDITASLLVSGEGGLGKTHTIKEKLAQAGLLEDQDYVIIKGYSTPKALYATLYENQNKLIVFDDCDSVLKDPISLNILKGALDNYDERIISWLSKGFITDDLPSSFKFTGRVIFISNLSLTKVDGAVKSRTLSVDLSMTLQDKIDRMRAIIRDIEPDYSLEVKTKVLDFLDINKEKAKELNMRTFEKAIKVLSYYIEMGIEDQGMEAIKYLLTNV